MSAHTGPSRIPPMSEQLEFICNGRSGKVHIKPWNPSPPDPVPVGHAGDKAVAVLLGPGIPMLCGHRMKYGFPGSPADYTTEFEDGDLCVPCVLALGDQQWRAFHADNRGGDR